MLRKTTQRQSAYGGDPLTLRRRPPATRQQLSLSRRIFLAFAIVSVLISSLATLSYLFDLVFYSRKKVINTAVASTTTNTDTDLSTKIRRDAEIVKKEVEQIQVLSQTIPKAVALTTASPIDDFWSTFYKQYGGKQAVNDILKKGVQQFGSLDSTAERLLRSAALDQPFVMAFAGYSVTVGRGNYYQQSFPFVIQRLLEPLFQATLNIGVTVRNAAIGGIPSFPYGYCFEHFLGKDPDVISWDFSMNEGSSGATVMEAYIRQSQTQLVERPMIIALDTNQARCKLLKEYTETNQVGHDDDNNNKLLSAALCVGMAKDVIDSAMLEQANLPPGLQDWSEFGAPPSCPGRGSWHPKKKEHELIGYMMASYFVRALEMALHLQDEHPQWRDVYKKHNSDNSDNVIKFPEPSQKPNSKNTLDVTNLLVGHKTTDNDNEAYYRVKDVSCRTNFMPATDTDKVLPSIVVSGLSPNTSSEDIIKSRSDQEYANGWVLDVSKVERDTKIKVEKCGGLGYVDMKIALYGVAESGPLRLWLPLEDSNKEHDNHEHGDNDTEASHWFNNLIICEANEKRGDKACKLDQDIEYTVGGVVVTGTSMIAGAGEYLKRPTCVHVGVPAGAQVTKLQDVKAHTTETLVDEETKRRLLGQSGDHVGLVVDIRAKSNVNRSDGACCISHVVWEQ